MQPLLDTLGSLTTELSDVATFIEPQTLEAGSELPSFSGLLNAGEVEIRTDAAAAALNASSNLLPASGESLPLEGIDAADLASRIAKSEAQIADDQPVAAGTAQTITRRTPVTHTSTMPAAAAPVRSPAPVAVAVTPGAEVPVAVQASNERKAPVADLVEQSFRTPQTDQSRSTSARPTTQAAATVVEAERRVPPESRPVDARPVIARPVIDGPPVVNQFSRDSRLAREHPDDAPRTRIHPQIPLTTKPSAVVGEGTPQASFVAPLRRQLHGSTDNGDVLRHRAPGVSMPSARAPETSSQSPLITIPNASKELPRVSNPLPKEFDVREPGTAATRRGAREINSMVDPGKYSEQILPRSQGSIEASDLKPVLSQSLLQSPAPLPYAGHAPTVAVSASNPPLTTGSAQPALMTLDTPVADPAWAEALQDRVLMLASRNIQAAEIRLSPAELGPLQVRVSVNEGAVEVAFGASNALTREALELAMPRLKELLSESGLELAGATVRDDGVAGRSQDDSSKAPTEAEQDEDRVAADIDAGPGDRPQPAKPQGLVDTFV